LQLSAPLGGPVVIDFGSLAARADAQTPRVRVFCNVRLRINVTAGFAVLIAAPGVKGASEHDTAGGAATLSVRWFETGTSGESWYRRIAGDEPGGDFGSTPPDWQPHWYGCGASPELNLLVDATARLRSAEPSGEAPHAEAITVQEVRIPGLVYKRCESAR
jgi:hypothetical protein